MNIMVIMRVIYSHTQNGCSDFFLESFFILSRMKMEKMKKDEKREEAGSLTFRVNPSGDH